MKSVVTVLFISLVLASILASNAAAIEFLQLTDSRAVDRHPSWTPDGQYIVFESNRNGSFDLFRVPSHGGAVERLTSDPLDERFPEVSPDGSRIAFSWLSHNAYGEMIGNIYSMPSSGLGTWTKVSTSTYAGDFDWHPAWSRDGSTIFFSRRKATDYWDWVVLQAPANGGPTTVFYDAQGLQNRPIPAWDGTTIALESNEAGSALNIYEMNINLPHKKEPLTFEAANTGAMGYSPDGKTMVYSSRKEKGWFDLYLLDLSTKISSQLTFDAISSPYDPNNADAVYSPDGTRIAFTSRRLTGNDNIWVIDLGLSASREVDIDVDPVSCPNEIARRFKGVLQIAITGSLELDPALVDAGSIRLQGSIVPDAWTLEDVTSPAVGPCACPAGGPDGFPDLVFDFIDWKPQDQALSPDKTITLNLTGSFMDGTQLHGSDCLTIIPHSPELQLPTAIVGIGPLPSGAATITYSVKEPGHVSLAAYDLSGRKVATVVDLDQSAGTFDAMWQTREIPAGVYFYRLTVGDEQDVRKFVILHP